MKCRKTHNHTFGKITGVLALAALGYMLAASFKDIVRYIKISNM